MLNKMMFMMALGMMLFDKVSAQETTKVENDQKIAIEQALGSFVNCAAGDFIMGSPDDLADRGRDEKPHKVSLSAFSIQSTEVTQRAWELVMKNNPSKDKTWKDYPVTNISYTMCLQFIEELNRITGDHYTLPTEAQWEYAAKAGSSGKMFAGSDSLKMVGWYTDNAGKRVHVVRELSPNAWGLYDMSGNVSEWCYDLYADYRLDSKYVQDPKGADVSKEYVIRGGSWKSEKSACRIAARGHNEKGVDKQEYGFRLIKLQ